MLMPLRVDSSLQMTFLPFEATHSLTTPDALVDRITSHYGVWRVAR